MEAVHNYHLSLGWSGIGYNFYIRKNGDIYEGRGWDNVGAHTEVENGISYNIISVGICCEGNYDGVETPPNIQLTSLIKMVAWAFERYNLTQNNVFGHKECNTTDCPGKMFPLTEVKNASGKYGLVADAAKSLRTREL